MSLYHNDIRKMRNFGVFASKNEVGDFYRKESPLKYIFSYET